jgi:ribosomal protein S18 acetylase RimI-like enzyme
MENMTLIIREPTLNDEQTLELIFLITRRKTFTSQPPESFQLSDYAESVAGEEMWVAEKNGVVVGFVSMWIKDDFIHNLFVHPDWHGLGIGSALLKKAESRLKYPMELKVKLENLIACKFYQKHGWIEVDVSHNPKEPFFSYRKDAPSS